MTTFDELCGTIGAHFEPHLELRLPKLMIFREGDDDEAFFLSGTAHVTRYPLVTYNIDKPPVVDRFRETVAFP